MKGLVGEGSRKLWPIIVGSVSAFVVVVAIIVASIVVSRNSISSVTLDTSSVSESYALDEGVDLGSIKLVVTKASGKTSLVAVEEKMITSEDLAKLKTTGTHTIVAVYKGYSVEITIKIENLRRVEFALSGRVLSAANVEYNSVISESIIPSIEAKEGFEVVWFSTINGVTTDADFSAPVCDNIRFDARYRAILTIKAAPYEKVFTKGSERYFDVQKNENVKYTLYNMDQDDPSERIFDVEFKNSDGDFYLGDDCVFKINLSDKYNQTPVIVKMEKKYSNGRTEWVELSRVDGYYRINNVSAAITIEVSNLKLNTYTYQVYNVYLDEEGEICTEQMRSGTANHGDIVASVVGDLNPQWKGANVDGHKPPFEKWSEGLDTKIKSNIKIYAIFEGVNLIEVHFDQDTPATYDKCETQFLVAYGEIDLIEKYKEKKDETEQYTYTFLRWEYRVIDEDYNVLSRVTIPAGATKWNVTDRRVAIVAVFSVKSKEYNVKLYNYDESYLGDITSHYGSKIDAESTPRPSRPYTKDIRYVFDHWSKVVDGEPFKWEQVTLEERDAAEFKLYAVFTEAPMTYDVRLNGGEGFTPRAVTASPVEAHGSYEFDIIFHEGYNRSAGNANFDVVATLSYESVYEGEWKLSDNNGTITSSSVDGGVKIVINGWSQATNPYDYGILFNVDIRILGATLNEYTIHYYDDVEGVGKEVFTQKVQHGNDVEQLKTIDNNIKKTTDAYLYYDCRWVNGSGQIISALRNVQDDKYIYLQYYKQFTLTIDGVSSVLDIIRGNDSVEKFSLGEYIDDEDIALGDGECIGWYTDEAFKMPYSDNNVFVSTIKPMLYTRKATLDKIEYAEGVQAWYRKDISITGVVVVPKKSSNDSTNQNYYISSGGFNGCEYITGVIIPTITSIGADAFKGCTNLQYVVVNDSITLGNFIEGKTKLFYSGSKATYDSKGHPIAAGNGTVYYYSDEQPDFTDPNNYWHYVNGHPMDWNACIVGDIRYEIHREDPTNTYAIAVEYLGGNPDSNWCLTLVGQITLGGETIPVTIIRNGIFKNLNMRSVMIITGDKNTYVEPGVFDGCGKINHIFVTDKSHISVATTYNALTYIRSLWYVYSESFEVGRYWHMVDNQPVVWSEVVKGDYIYSLDSNSKTAILMSYNGQSESIDIGLVEDEGISYHVTGISSYAVSYTLRALTFSEELEDWCIDNSVGFSFDYSAMYNVVYSVSVNIHNFDFWRLTTFADEYSNPLIRSGQIKVWDTGSNEYKRIDKVEIRAGEEVSNYQYQGADISSLVIYEGAKVGKESFYSTKLNSLTIVVDSNNLYTSIGEWAFKGLTFDQTHVSISIKTPSGTSTTKTNWNNWIFASNNTNIQSALGIT